MVQGALATTGMFYGDNIELDNNGSYQVTLIGHKEEYVITPPAVAVSGMITGTPWWELDGQSTITCAKTGYRAEINYTPAERGQWYHLKNKIQVCLFGEKIPRGAAGVYFFCLFSLFCGGLGRGGQNSSARAPSVHPRAKNWV